LGTDHIGNLEFPSKLIPHIKYDMPRVLVLRMMKSPVFMRLARMMKNR